MKLKNRLVIKTEEETKSLHLCTLEESYPITGWSTNGGIDAE